MTEWGQPQPWATVIAGCMYFWALLALWALTLGEASTLSVPARSGVF